MKKSPSLWDRREFLKTVLAGVPVMALDWSSFPTGKSSASDADVYDAITTRRPYHPAQTYEEVVQILKSESGKHFDPDLVPIFINALEKHR